MEREVGGGIGMGKTCKLKDVSFQCMTKKKKKRYVGSKKKKKKKNISCVFVRLVYSLIPYNAIHMNISVALI